MGFGACIRGAWARGDVSPASDAVAFFEKAELEGSETLRYVLEPITSHCYSSRSLRTYSTSRRPPLYTSTQ